jgi:hypothetical protein
LQPAAFGEHAHSTPLLSNTEHQGRPSPSSNPLQPTAVNSKYRVGQKPTDFVSQNNVLNKKKGVKRNAQF